ncbi:immunity protein Imm1 of predicted polymorphic toxin system [Micromonospora sp. Llam0]|uniref:Imm1 family immunity protein n=1 Tax=Micromonospora sp. Llam0 TaxID=2485143 RepID=UPI000F4A0B04|nr:Imm1 family immunity protein [Micromonospora sp. Llam0]ROO63100.1 immunity protein Imm1 of predicted polymorphic toxin system [Micromonospora sp. Llam0]
MSSEPVTVSYDRAEPVAIDRLDDLDTLLDRIAATPEYQRFPVMVSLETSDKEHVLEVCLGRHDLSVLVWHHTFVEIAASKGTLDQPADLAYNFGGSRTDAYDNSAIPVTTARQAVQEFFTTNGQRPTCLDWQTPSYDEQDEPAKG